MADSKIAQGDAEMSLVKKYLTENALLEFVTHLKLYCGMEHFHKW